MTIRVVIAEDQAMVLGALAALLEMEDDIHVVAQVRNGRDALQTVLASTPDVVITDIEMPRMNGLEMIRALRAKEELRKVPVITLSALKSREVRAQAIEAGADHFLTKADLDEEYLLDLVRSLTA